MKQLPAFPQDYPLYAGLSLRDYFAAKAMSSILLSESWVDDQDMAQTAYAIADAMLEARK